MPLSVRFAGQTLVKPGVATVVNLDQLNNLLFGETGAMVIIGEADGGQPNPQTGEYVYNVFTDPSTMIDTLFGGRGQQAASLCFDPVKGGQYSGNARLQGATRVTFIKTNQSGQAGLTLLENGGQAVIRLNSKLWGTPGNYTSVTLTASESGRIVTAKRNVRPGIGTQASPALGRPTTYTGWDVLDARPATPGTGANKDMWWALQYTGTGTAATATYNPAGDSLTTALTGQSGGETNLSITLSDYKDINALIAYINTQTGYRAVLIRSDRGGVATNVGDDAAAVNILENTGNNFWPAMGSVYDIVKWVNDNSAYLDAVQLTSSTTPVLGSAGYEIPATLTETFLSGGTLGVTGATDITRAMDAAKKVNAKHFASLFDADLATPTIDSINAAFNTLANDLNSVRLPHEGQIYIAKATSTRDAAIETAALYGNDFVQLVAGQDVKRPLPDGSTGYLSSWALTVMAAAARAGSPLGVPLTNKYINVLDVRSNGYDPSDIDDAEALLLGGVLFTELNPGKGFRFVDDITTNTENNDGKRYGEVVEERVHLSRMLRENIEDLYIGAKGRGVPTTEAVRDRVISVLSLLADPNSADQILIETTDENGAKLKPYRNIKAALNGSIINITGEVTFSQGIRWVLNEFIATPPRAVITP